MKLTPQVKARIDALTYEAMLRKNRFAPVGDPIFQGESGIYFQDMMGKKRELLAAGEAVVISKKIGWNPDKEKNER